MSKLFAAESRSVETKVVRLPTVHCMVVEFEGPPLFEEEFEHESASSESSRSKTLFLMGLT
jgi:hypothetical protein